MSDTSNKEEDIVQELRRKGWNAFRLSEIDEETHAGMTGSEIADDLRRKDAEEWQKEETEDESD